MAGIFEYATGSDSFSAIRPNYDARSVMLTAHVFNPRSGFFENPRSLSHNGDVCKVKKVHKAIPASTKLAVSVGNWYFYRAEVLGGALWCFEFKRKSDESAFSFVTESLLVRASMSAPLQRVRLLLPEHPYANVPELDFVWNARRIHAHSELVPHELAAFKKLTGETSNFIVEATQDDSELTSWEFATIEKAKPSTKKVIKSKTGKAVAINRVKKLKL